MDGQGLKLTAVATGGFVPRDGEMVECRRLRVDPSHQRRGYGQRLLATLEDRAAARGYRRVVLETNARLRAARRLYETRGYEETGCETRSDDGGTVVRYRRRLDRDDGPDRC